MKTISLRDLARTGRFDELEIGDSRARVEEVLGAPRNWGSQLRKERAAIWKYGDIEFYFDRDHLWMIFSDHFQVLRGENFRLDAWVLSGHARVEDVVAGLERENIPFRRDVGKGCERGVRLETATGVFFTFCGERERKPRLISFCRR